MLIVLTKIMIIDMCDILLLLLLYIIFQLLLMNNSWCKMIFYILKCIITGLGCILGKLRITEC